MIEIFIMIQILCIWEYDLTYLTNFFLYIKFNKIKFINF